MNTAVLESIELDNFLSFTTGRVSFITSSGTISKFSIITGPNGSGKSSIYQALKFVLGSNEKDGRYARWEDFININGDFMRVKATFRSEDGRATSITRLMRKNKTSTFYLNDKATSAVSVNAFISSMKVSPDNIFSFVSQGQVNAIKDLSPRNLFFLIEAGIGVAGLRHRIEQESFKIDGLQEEIRTLDGQKANRVKMGRVLEEKMEKLREKRDLESHMLVASAEKKWAQKVDLGNKIASIASVMTEKQGHLDDLRVAIEETGKERKHLQESMAWVDERSMKAKVDLGSLERELGELKKEIAAWDGKKRALLEAHQQIKKEEETLASEQDIMEKDRNEIKSIMAGVVATKNDLTNEKSGLHARQATIRQELVKNQDWLDARNELARSLDSATRDKESNGALLEKIGKDIDGLIGEIEDINKELSSSTFFSTEPGKDTQSGLSERKTTLARSIERMTAERDAAKTLEQDLRKQLGRSSGSANRKRDQLKFMKELKAELEARGLHGRIQGPIFEHLDFDPLHARAIEAVFKKNALLGFVAFDDEDFKMLNSLRNKLKVHCFIYMPKRERARETKRERPAVPGVIDYMTNLVQVPSWLEPVFKDIVRDTIVVESFAVAVSLIKTDDRARCVTLEGVTVDSGKHALRSAPQTDEAGILSGDDGSMDDLSLRLNHVSALVTKLDDSIDRARKEMLSVDKEGEELKRVQFFLKQKAILGRKKDDALDEKDKARKRLATIDITIHEIQAKIDEHQHAKPKEFLALLDDAKRVDDRLEEIDSILRERSEELVAVQSRQADNQQRAEVLEKKRVDLAARGAALRDEIEASAGDFNRVEREMEDIKASIVATSTRIAEFNAERGTLNTQLEDIQKATTDLEIQVKLVIVDMERLEGEIDALQREREYIDTYLRDAEAPAELKSIEEYDAIIKGLQSRLGSVEFMYITDAIETESRENQRVLDNLEAKLEEVAQEINKIAESSDELKRDYLSRMEGHVKCLQDAINGKFASLGVPFRVILAVNGRFDEPGLSIRADFFENEFLPINALSEGQKSIIALALMLTLQDLNPSPICVFDEAHIFLDEANKDLISKLIKKSTEHTQLIMMVPTTSHGFIMTADKIIGVARQCTKQGACMQGDNDQGVDGMHLGPSRIIELARG